MEEHELSDATERTHLRTQMADPVVLALTGTSLRFLLLETAVLKFLPDLPPPTKKRF